MKTYLPLFFLSLIFVAPVIGETPKPLPSTTAVSALLEKIQTAWEKTTSYKANFKQVLFTKRLGTREESAGTLSVVKPGKLRWETNDGSSIQILNGKKLVHIHERKRKKSRVVDIYKDVAHQIDTKMLGFLAGQTPFREWYRSEVLRETPEKIEVRITPRDAKNPLPSEIYTVEFDPKTFYLLALINDTAESKVRIDFSEIKTNAAIDKTLFEYVPSENDTVQNQ